MNVADEVIRLFETNGQTAYFGEAVSVLEHSLQTAALAARNGSADSLIVAALVHDIGHLLHGADEQIAWQGINARHEVVGDQWLRSRFGPAVTEPVRLHVEAKRYLCSVDPAYLERLSAASIQSLQLQGGPYNGAGIEAFEANEWFRDAISLRRWDDTAKTSGLAVPGLSSYYEAIEREAGVSACSRARLGMASSQQLTEPRP